MEHPHATANIMKENGLLRIHVPGETNSYLKNQGIFYACMYI